MILVLYRAAIVILFSFIVAISYSLVHCFCLFVSRRGDHDIIRTFCRVCFEDLDVFRKNLFSRCRRNCPLRICFSKTNVTQVFSLQVLEYGIAFIKKYEIFGRISDFYNMTVRPPTHHVCYGLCFHPHPQNTPVSVGVSTVSTVIWCHLKCSCSIIRQVSNVENNLYHSYYIWQHVTCDDLLS
jgi:hypothetical protein